VSPASATVRKDLFDPEFMRRLESLEIASRKIFTGKMRGEKRSRRKGFSQEFADYRDYVHGDDLRHLDWNVYGRLDKLFLKMFYEEEDLHLHLLVDGSRSMDFGDPNKFAYARQVAAAIGYVGLVNLNPVSIRVLRKGEESIMRTARGERMVWRMMDFLQGVQPDAGTDLAGGLKRFAISRPRRGVAILISDFLDRDGYDQALKWLLGAGMESYVLHVLAPQEVQPSLRGDLKLMDMEDADLVELSLTGNLAKSYEKTLAAFRAGLAASCSKYGMAYTFSSTGSPFDELVLLYLRRAGLVK